MKKPLIAIIGRPNVGKSTLFNKIIGKRAALVANIPGVTRDRNFADCSWDNHSFILIDTGGFEPIATTGLIAQIKEQTQVAIEEADLVIFLVDGKEGLTPSDREVGLLLKKSGISFILAVNKIDDEKHYDRIHDFYPIGAKELLPVSAEHSIGVGNLLDKAVSLIPKFQEDEQEETGIKIAVVGKPNVGKSSLINNILGSNRMLVSDIPGTTMDSVDSYFRKDDDEYIFIDTAGIRKKRRIVQQLEKYSILMSLRSIDRCHIALLLIDGELGITDQDVKIAGYIHEAGKGAIIIINKWDKIKKDTNTFTQYSEIIKTRLKYMPYAPVISLSALSGQRVDKIFPLINTVSQEQKKIIPTPELNTLIQKAAKRRYPRAVKGRPVKFYYATQVNTIPPSFLIFTNYPQAIHFSYSRFLQNELRKEYTFTGTPISIVFKERERKTF